MAILLCRSDTAVTRSSDVVEGGLRQQSVSKPAEETLAEVSGQPWKRKQRQKIGLQHLWDKAACARGQPRDQCRSTVVMQKSTQKVPRHTA